MAYDALMWLFLAVFLIPANIYAIKWHRRGRFALWASGIILAIFGVGIGFAVGGILMAGNTGQGGSIMAAFIGLVVVANGLIYFVIGLAMTIGKQFTKKNTQV